MINVLTFTLLYPNPAEPSFGIFVENRIRRLVETRQVALSVVAPVPWFPLTWKRFGRYAAYARVPRHEIRHGIEDAQPDILSGIPRCSLPPLLLSVYGLAPGDNDNQTKHTNRN